MSEIFDVVVIGAGPGGYVAAIRSAQCGLSTCVIEREHLGGICLNWGCIPTKALLRSAEILRYHKHGQEFGITSDAIQIDLHKMIERSRDVSSKLNKGVRYLLTKNKVNIIEATANLLEKKDTHHVIETTDAEGKAQQVLAKNIIIATGAKAKNLPNLPADGQQVWTYKHALMPPKQPKSMAIIGSGAIGVEFASFYNEIGVEVHIIEMQPTIVPNEDKDIATFLEKSFKKNHINIYTQTAITHIECLENSVVLSLEKNQKAETLEVEVVLVAIGITPNTNNVVSNAYPFELDNKGHIITHDYCQTSIGNIYAIGDVTKGPWLAHKAEHEAVMVAEHIAGLSPHKINYHAIPGCTYCHPQIASLGLTEQKAKEQNYDISVGIFPFRANGKALALGEEEGFIKTIFDKKTGELLGAHLIGAEVTELIQGFGIAKTLEATEQDFMHTIFPHPTLSEMIHESVLDAFNRVIHG